MQVLTQPEEENQKHTSLLSSFRREDTKAPEGGVMHEKRFDLEKIKTKIESMGKHHHIEILKILKKYPGVRLNENKSGVFINLSFLQSGVIDEMIQYIDFISVQEDSIRYLENQREEYKNIFFVDEKQDKDCSLLYNS